MIAQMVPRQQIKLILKTKVCRCGCEARGRVNLHPEDLAAFPFTWQAFLHPGPENSVVDLHLAR